jgi:hypothetical protein
MHRSVISTPLLGRPLRLAVSGVLVALVASCSIAGAATTASSPARATTQKAQPSATAHRRVRAHHAATASAHPVKVRATHVTTQSAAGMRIFRDPETGELGPPSAAQAAELSAKRAGTEDLEFSGAGLQEVHHPDGSVSMDLQGRFQEYAVIRRDANGHLVQGCVPGAKAARKFMQAAASPPAPVLEEK